MIESTAINSNFQPHRSVLEKSQLSKTDFKTHVTVVLSYVLLTIGIALACALPYFLTVIHPMIAASTPALPVALGVLGLQQSQQPIAPNWDTLAPIGLKQRNNNCFLNSAIQFLTHCYQEELASKRKQLTEDQYLKLFNFLKVYDTLLKEQGQKPVSNIPTETLRPWLYQMFPESKVTSDDDTQDDPIYFLSYIFKTLQISLPTIIEKEKDVHNGVTRVDEEKVLKDELAITLFSENEGTMAEYLQYWFNREDEPRITTRSASMHWLDELEENTTLDAATKKLYKERFNSSKAVPLKKIYDLAMGPYTNKKVYTNYKQFLTPPKHLSIFNSFGHLIPTKDALELRLAKEQCGEDASYECTAFIQRRVLSENLFHYVTYIKKEGSWYEANDAVVTKISARAALKASKHASIYHYLKKNKAS